MYDRILVPLDGSELAERVLPYVEALAGKFGSNLTLLRAVAQPSAFLASTAAAPLLPQPSSLYAAGDPTALAEVERKEAADYLESIAARLSNEGLQGGTLLPVGPPAEAILAQAEALNADLIAMTTHGRSGLARLVMGSVADEVVRRALCPILLVRVMEASAPNQPES